MSTYLKVSPNEFNEIYSQENVCRITALVIISVFFFSYGLLLTWNIKVIFNYSFLSLIQIDEKKDFKYTARRDKSSFIKAPHVSDRQGKLIQTGIILSIRC